jgi:hypothetical protein
MRAHIVLRRMRNCTWCKRRGQFKPKKKDAQLAFCALSAWSSPWYRWMRRVLRCVSQAARPAELSFLPCSCLARAVWMPPCIAQKPRLSCVCRMELVFSSPDLDQVPCFLQFRASGLTVVMKMRHLAVMWPMFWPGQSFGAGQKRAGHNQSIETAEWQTWPTMTTRVWTNTSALQSSNTAK